MFSYTAYNVAIRAEFPLPELIVTEAMAGPIIRLGKVAAPTPQRTRDRTRFRVTSRETVLRWDDVGVFVVRGGEEIVVDPVRSVDERVLRIFILGPILAILLHQRGRLVLHASALSIEGEAVAFLGGSGWGKSTVAAALYARGHAVVADDVVALDIDDASGPMTYPGYPQLKLWPEAVAMLGGAPDTLPRLHPMLEKRAYRAARGFSTKPVRLRCIYVLAEGPSQRVEELEPQAAFVELIRHTYTARLLDSKRTASHFLQCGNLAAKVPIRRLVSQRSLAALPNLATLVEKDLAAMHC